MSSLRRTIWASAIGGGLELYDFLLCLFLAPILGRLFFPASSHWAALMQVFLVFALSYCVRPLGGILFGHLGDRWGRRKAFSLSLLCMALPSVFLAFLPSYAVLGLWAPFLFLLCRLVQGVAMGGEMPGLMAFCSEHLDEASRGHAYGLLTVGINCGMLLAQGMMVLLPALLGASAFQAWGWRFLFLSGGLLGMVGQFVRARLQETPAFEQCSSVSQKAYPLLSVLKTHRKLLWRGFCLEAVVAVSFYFVYVYFGFYLAHLKQVFSANVVWPMSLKQLTLMSTVLMTTGLGLWGQRIGRIGCARLLQLSLKASFVVLLLGAVLLLKAFGFWSVCVCLVIWACVLSALFLAVFYSIAELFPTEVRYTGIAVSYNMAYALLGGTTPLISTALLHHTGALSAPWWFVLSIIGLGAWGLRARFK